MGGNLVCWSLKLVVLLNKKVVNFFDFKVYCLVCMDIYKYISFLGIFIWDWRGLVGIEKIKYENMMVNKEGLKIDLKKKIFVLLNGRMLNGRNNLFFVVEMI